MRNSQKAITTHTTIAETKTDILSSQSIASSGFGVLQRRNQKRPPQRTVSIMEEASGKKMFSRQSTEINLKQGNKVIVNHAIEVTENCRTVDVQIINVLNKIFFKKKRYCFQVLKQFYLFPDESQSSIQSLSVYDPLVFQEEIIHSLVKIMETRLITNKIWGFLNLKMMPFLKAAKKIEEKVTEIQQKTIRRQKKYSFDMIKIAAQDAISAIQKPDIIKQSRCLQINTSYLYNQNKQVQCGMDEKVKVRKSYLSSNIVHEQVRPSIVAAVKTQVKPVCESTTRVYTRQEYELKYGKMKERNQNYQPKIVKISCPENHQRKSNMNEINTNIHTYNTTTEYRVPTSRIIYTEPKPNIQLPIIKQETKVITQMKSPRKYNIIHYHERPRELNHPTNLQEIKICSCTLNNSSLSHTLGTPCMNTCCYCEPCSFVSQSRISCCVQNTMCNQSTFCQKYQKNDIINQTRVSDHVKFINEPKSIKNTINASLSQEYELSELESRIQYLNFLKSLVKEQQMQESASI